MPPDRSHDGPRPSLSAGAVAFAALASLLAAACSGEQAFGPRDGSGLAGFGGATGVSGNGGTGTGGSVGDGGASGGSVIAGGGGETGNGGTTGASGGSSAGGTAGATGGGAAGSAGARGGSGGSAGTAGTGGTAGKGNGMTCMKGMECASTYCFDGVCCASDCTGTCRTCNGASPGTCVFVPNDMDPREQCPDETSTNMCGRTGACNGSGSCRYAGSTVVCASTPACDNTTGSIVSTKVCNGAGMCVAGMTQSCNGYRCSDGPPPACGTSCTADSACAAGGFCSAGTCIPSANLVGNGDLETGTATGWIIANGSAVLGLSAAAASGAAHAGGYSIFVSGRTAQYVGPGYNIPTGVGKYVISGWAMQRDQASIAGLLQLRLACRTSVYYREVQPPGTTFGVTMNQNVWTQFTGTVDLGLLPDECLPTAATPGLIRLNTLYLNQTQDTAVPPLPDLYLDDVVVQVTDGHNLVGNPGFEASYSDGWTLSTGSSMLAVSSTVARTGTYSLHQTMRSVPAAGPRYALTNGTAKYDFSIWVKHMGTQPRDLILQPTYNCISPSTQMMPPPIAAELGVTSDTWTELKGTGTFPPADAPAGCKLQSAAIYIRTDGMACAGQVECPDLFVDDVSIKIAP